MQRRRLLQLAGVMAAAGGPSAALWADEVLQAEKVKDLSLVVPFPPGGGGDILARAVVTPLAQSLNRGLVILNRPGAGGNIGTAQVVKAQPTSGTVGYVTNGIMCVNPHLYERRSFDPLTELCPVAGLTTIGLVLAVSPKLCPDVKTVDDLVLLAKSRPGETAFASAGVGTTSHLAGALFEAEAGLELNHIPHAGGAAAVNEVLAGRIPFLIDVMPNLLPHIRAGALRALAVTTEKRSSLLADLPTMAEAGFAGATLFAWDGIAAPIGFPEREANAIAEAARQVLETPELRSRLLRLGAEPTFCGPAAFADFIRTEAERWKPLAERARAQR